MDVVADTERGSPGAGRVGEWSSVGGVSWIARSVEERLARAAANGELDAPTLKGKPIADLDRRRPDGWWADQFVARERSHDRLEEAQRKVNAARSRFWNCPDLDALRVAVDAANDLIDEANGGLIASDRIARFDHVDIRDRWNRLRR